jgi:hypothetical protein
MIFGRNEFCQVIAYALTHPAMHVRQWACWRAPLLEKLETTGD